jgi:hypothetical protein
MSAPGQSAVSSAAINHGHSALKSSGTSPNFFSTTASEKREVKFKHREFLTDAIRHGSSRGMRKA